MHDALARQMRRQRPPRWPFAVEAFHLDFRGRSQLGMGVCVRRILFQVGELKLKLFEDGTAFRGLPNCSWRSLAIVNFSFSINNACDLASLSAAAARASAAIVRVCAAASASRCTAMVARAAASVVGSESDWRGTLEMLTQLRWQRAPNPHYESIGRAFYPAACGRHVCCGMRQSMPSSR
jgi:hypothetical protein